MCGIIGFIPKQHKTKSSQRIKAQYQDQHTRGQDGFGIIHISPQRTITTTRSTEPISALLDLREQKDGIIFFHHRYPTSSQNLLSQTHPISVSHDELDYDWLIMHNGVIKNEDAVRKTHEELEEPYTYNTLIDYQLTKKNEFSDSETFAIELARYLEGITEKIEAVGSAAFLGVCVNKKTGKAEKAIWGRGKGRPLETLETKAGILIGSSIFSPSAENIDELTAHELDLKKFLETKQKPADIYDSNLLTSWEVKMDETLPITVPSRAWGRYAVKNTTPSTESTNASDNKVTNANSYEEVRTPREIAFQKMADRTTERIATQIEIIFEQMAYEEVSESEIKDIAEGLEKTLIEKNKEATEQIRNNFDVQETKEMEEEFAKEDHDEEAAAADSVEDIHNPQYPDLLEGVPSGKRQLGFRTNP